MEVHGPAVAAELIRALYRQSTAILATSAINAGLVTAALWQHPRRPLLLAWLGAVIALSAARLVLARLYLARTPTDEAAPAWRRYFVCGSAVNGLLWGLLGATFYDAEFGGEDVVLTFTIGGMTAAAAGTLAWHLPAFFAFVGPTLLLTGARVALLGGPYTLAAVLVGIYAVGLTVVARNNHIALAQAVRLRFENEALIQDLKLARESLEEMNRTLETRVAERSAALEAQAEALTNARRLESLGLLAGGVAHDLNNLLTVITLNVDLLEAEGRPSTDEASPKNEIKAASDRAAELVRRLLAFGRKQVMMPRVLDLNRLVLDIEPLLRRLTGEQVQLTLTLHQGPLWLKADPGQLEQVLVNLVTNARDAMPEGGHLGVTTAIQANDGDGAPKGLSAPRGLAVLRVQDSGVGMDAETRARAFDPFFTTKALGHGTGLGLATVHGIVEQSGGRVTVDSRPRAGSVFTVYLPLSASPAETEALAASPPKETFPVGVTVLVAEDDHMVRGVLVRTLADAGLPVFAVDDGEQALAWGRARAGKGLDLLITDVIMPRLGGAALVRALAPLQPGMRVLFISGYSAQASLPPPQPELGLDYLEKPFTPEQLRSAVARLLAAPGGAATAWVAGGAPMPTPAQPKA